MMKKMMLLGAGAVGYVLGARAGRERYDQIAQQAQKLRSNPTVQQKVDEAKHVAKDAAGTATDKVRSQVGHNGSSDPVGTRTGTPTGTPTGTTSFGQGNEAR
jgi:outer membrane murein-binding lipoprotein Lpp